MTIHIALSPDSEARLRERAAALGQDVECFVLETLEEKLAMPAGNGFDTASTAMDLADWLHRFDVWVATHPRLGFEVDDSREHVYAGRGE